MCDTCNQTPKEVYKNWLFHHPPIDSYTVRFPDSRIIAIDAILSYRLDTFTHDEMFEHYNLDKDKLEEVTFLVNKYLSNIEEVLLNLIH